MFEKVRDYAMPKEARLMDPSAKITPLVCWQTTPCEFKKRLSQILKPVRILPFAKFVSMCAFGRRERVGVQTVRRAKVMIGTDACDQSEGIATGGPPRARLLAWQPLLNARVVDTTNTGRCICSSN